jgi:hypothetical protein
MKKSILELEGVFCLTKNEKKSINGGVGNVHPCKVTQSASCQCFMTGGNWSDYCQTCSIPIPYRNVSDLPADPICGN